MGICSSKPQGSSNQKPGENKPSASPQQKEAPPAAAPAAAPGCGNPGPSSGES
ncbi:hypothetical protein DIPPA_17747 [Diplonema papillatum]|nr:hypothetical protein DIPPA_17747 [Diplonema papillatum]